LASHPINELCQVKLLITNNAFFIVQRATVQSKTGIFRNYGVAEAAPGFQAGLSDCMYFFGFTIGITYTADSHRTGYADL
jgi:hypothetical protein